MGALRYPFLIFMGLVMAAAFAGVLAHAQTVGVTLPSIPTGITTSVGGAGQISVSWSASTETSGTIEGYYVYRNGQQITTTAGTSIVDLQTVSGVYGYTIVAYDANGNVSPQSAVANATFIKDTTPPSMPKGVTITGVTTTRDSFGQVPITISWSASTDNVGVVGYNVYRDGRSIVSSSAPWSGTSINDTVTPGTYSYSVTAYDAAQNTSERSAPGTVTIGVNTTPPSIPANVSAQQISATGVNLSWATSTGPLGIATGYQVFRNGIQIATAGGPSYADSGLSTGFTYTYTVTAYDIAGNISPKSAVVTIIMQLANGPAVPYVLSVLPLGTSTVNVSWSLSGDVVPITGYTVYRNGAQIASVTTTNYVDMALATGTYSYNVSASDLSGAVSAISPSSTNITVPIATFVPPVVAAPPIVTPPNPTSSLAVAGGSVAFTQTLYFGLRGTQVQALQVLLSGKGYLASANTTGFFGNLTLHALQKFQCDQNIVCTGGAGWGMVGPRTRSVLNNFGKH